VTAAHDGRAAAMSGGCGVTNRKARSAAAGRESRPTAAYKYQARGKIKSGRANNQDTSIMSYYRTAEHRRVRAEFSGGGHGSNLRAQGQRRVTLRLRPTATKAGREQQYARWLNCYAR
jgi:hypothetical protein